LVRKVDHAATVPHSAFVFLPLLVGSDNRKGLIRHMLSRAAQRHVKDRVRDSRHWERYTPRAGDVVVATAPKVGTTWTQRIVSLLIFQSPAPKPIMQVSPWLDCRFQIPIDVMIPMLEAQTHRRAVKSHLPFDALPIYDEVKYIHTGRRDNLAIGRRD
jgi:aryl sulfotransferase